MPNPDDLKPKFLLFNEKDNEILKRGCFSSHSPSPPCPPNPPPLPFNKSSIPPTSNNDIMKKLIDMENELKEIKAILRKLVEKEQKNN